jgi:hypothetical protein
LDRVGCSSKISDRLTSLVQGSPIDLAKILCYEVDKCPHLSRQVLAIWIERVNGNFSSEEVPGWETDGGRRTAHLKLASAVQTAN